MSEILITGGAGNLGRALARALLEAGHSLRILDLPSRDLCFFDGWEKTSVIPGDLLDPPTLGEAVRGVQWVYHLAAILPPASERDMDLTFRVNVEGTRMLLKQCAVFDPPPKVVFASSVSVYGDTSHQKGLIGPADPVHPKDIYGQSKARAEELLFGSGVPFVDLRITAIALAEFLDPPEPWPFRRDQRIELIYLGDLVGAMARIPRVPEVLGSTLVLAGGPSWQVTGEAYVRRWAHVMDIPFEEMSFQEEQGWLSWYDTAHSQDLLNYQKTSLDEFFKLLSLAVEEAIAE